MHLISVNIGKERPIQNGKPSNKTGIYKLPVSHAVQITALGLLNDAVCDKKNHGGVDQAVYIYGGADYDWWSTELGRTIEPGAFGDNLTISELESAQFLVGDRLHVGAQVVLEVTAPRIPCGTLAARMGDVGFVKRFRMAERPGLYCRVIQAGAVQAGDVVSVERYRGEALPVVEIFREYYNPQPSKEYMQRYLNTPTAIRGRNEIEKELKKSG